MTEVKVLHLVEGAKEAEGIAVIIDVFRAFTLEACMYGQGAREIYITGELERAYECKKEHPEYILCGERHGKICPGFDLGNSPAAVMQMDLKGKTVIHTSSNGTKGIENASHADVVLTGALVNAKATAQWIRKQNPALVSLVAMGWEGKRTEEDELCAQYLKALILNQPFEGIEQKALDLKYSEGRKFFDPAQKEVFPEGDFWISIKHDIYDFAIKVEPDGKEFRTIRENMHA